MLENSSLCAAQICSSVQSSYFCLELPLSQPNKYVKNFQLFEDSLFNIFFSRLDIYTFKYLPYKKAFDSMTTRCMSLTCK